jgi:hypothetical protein
MTQELQEQPKDQLEDQPEDQFKQQVDELLINVRNEAIVQAANLYMLGRQALLTSIGLGALTIDVAQNLLQRAVERGEIAEADAQAVLQRMQDERLAKSGDGGAAGASLTDRAAVALADSTSAILKALHLRSTKE